MLDLFKGRLYGPLFIVYLFNMNDNRVRERSILVNTLYIIIQNLV